ncbi:hypothetical protein [Archaeoglobus neptunius]|uniref:hypothetical protein n=1 Tax=Archaeoglobus neptunius TaxID=2798580 RepID=UPI00192823F1|nr:hypothetical protein [Archaeoglobus neptunius]
MGYMVEVRSHDIFVLNDEKVRETIETFDMDHIFTISDEHLTFREYTFKMPANLYLFFAAIADAVEGFVEFQGEDGPIWKVDIKDGRVAEYSATITFEKSYETEKVDVDYSPIVNERYVAAWIHEDALLAYDLVEDAWFKVWLTGSISDVETVKQIQRGEALPAYHLYDPAPHELATFAKKLEEANTDVSILKTVTVSLL